ncbi:cytidylyltransferase domain-containing protein [Rudaeicoccus suwonensis]|uniref:Spore coat polysaccharide biosynthesis protein SpsF n=1 Tax=Rudaeicoccus suwonensis TaxID=657409 RepID=A0A561E901_9MICO|nr:NTP transferase domain-containing protein [Rudaeicoccus suwonensis]TWE12104.1 spore coat polysaccharide biosynthesis protein SpsF [Rudaeicoccus suwonensis]
MGVRVLIQSRLSSSRLPGKALLTLAGRPLVVLAAQRASNTGMDVVVATSSEPEDDVLAAALQVAEVPVFRGPLHDTLHRFTLAVADLADDDLVVRLTGDNVGPDGDYLQTLIAAMQQAGENYIRVTTETIYGMGVEVFTAGVLRAADREATSSYDREHVTPWIRRHTADLTWIPPVEGAAGRVRCTVDTLLDFTIAAHALAGVGDPVSAGWRELLDAWVSVGGAKPEPLPGSVPNPIGLGPWVLGGSQLGATTNADGEPDAAEASRLMERAVASGVTHIETSLSYAGSAPRVGQSLAHGLSERVGVIALLPTGLPDGADAAAWETLARLRYAAVDVLVTANWADWLQAAEALSLTNASSIARCLGTVVADEHEFTAAIEDPRLGYVELPLELADLAAAAPRELVVVVRCPDAVTGARLGGVPGVTAALVDAGSVDQVREQAEVFGRR